MPRKARLIVPGELYHVMNRCLPMYQLFTDDVDRKHFLMLLSTSLLRNGYKFYTWVLKVFAYCACRVHNAPTTKVGEFLGVGGAAVSAMAAKGEAVAEKQRLDI